MRGIVGPDDILPNGWLNGRLRSYLYAGGGPARWLASLGRATEPLRALMTADQPLLSLVSQSPLAETWSLPAVLGLLTATSTPTEEAGGDKRPGPRSTAAPARPVVVPQGAAGLPSRFTTALEGDGTRARRPTARPRPPKGWRRLTRPELESLAGQSRIAERLSDAGRRQAQGSELVQGGRVPRVPLAEMPPATTASATLTAVLGQRPLGRPRPDYHHGGVGVSNAGQPRAGGPKQHPSPGPSPIRGGEGVGSAILIEMLGQQPPGGQEGREARGQGERIAWSAPPPDSLSAWVRRGFAQPVSGPAAPRKLLLRLAREGTAFQVESAAWLGGSTSSVPANPPPGESPEPMGAVLGVPGGASTEGRTRAPLTLATAESRPGSSSRPVATTTVLQTLVNAWPRSCWQDSHPSAAEAPPPETVTPPAVQNTFNVTVHIAGGVEDETELADRIARILIDQARRHGIDVA